MYTHVHVVTIIIFIWFHLAIGQSLFPKDNKDDIACTKSVVATPPYKTMGILMHYPNLCTFLGCGKLISTIHLPCTVAQKLLQTCMKFLACV